MELKEGMYVRTEEGEISKIRWITVQKWEGLENTIEASFMLENNESLEYSRDNFKASDSIIDLIEPGDYVNGMEVIVKDSDNRLYVPNDLGEPYDREFYNGCFEYTLLEVENFKIKNIVTKEQFESIKYEVK